MLIAGAVFMAVIAVVAMTWVLMSSLPAFAGTQGQAAVTVTATSTTYTVTSNGASGCCTPGAATTSVQILATSSRATAVALTVFNCSVGANIFIRQAGDKLANATTGMLVLGSTTLTMGDIAPMPFDNLQSIQASSTLGTCQVNVTEWRKNF